MTTKSLPPGQYGAVPHAGSDRPRTFTEINLGELRTGLHACNPAGAVLLVREIDRLRSIVDEANVLFVSFPEAEWEPK